MRSKPSATFQVRTAFGSASIESATLVSILTASYLDGIDYLTAVLM